MADQSRILRHLHWLLYPTTHTKPASIHPAQLIHWQSRLFPARWHHHRPSNHQRHQQDETPAHRRPFVMPTAFIRPLRSTSTASTTTRMDSTTFGTVRLRFEVPHGLPSYARRVEMVMASLRCRRWMVRRWKCNNQPKTQRNNNSIDKEWCLAMFLGGKVNSFTLHSNNPLRPFRNNRRGTEEVQKMCLVPAPSGKT